MSRRPRRPATLTSIFDRSMREQRRNLAGWVAGLIGFCLIMLSIYPTVRGNQSFAKLLEAYPEVFRKLFQVSDYTTGPGYVRAEVFSFMAPLLIAIFAVLQGSDLLAGEEERRTIDVFLANPVSRRKVVVEKWLALAASTATLSVVLELMLGLVGPLFRLHIGWAPLSAEVLGSGIFALFAGTLAMAVGAATGARGIARGISTAVAVVMYLLSTLAQIVSWLIPARPVSLWYHALGIDPFTSGFPYWHVAVVLAVIILLFWATIFLFDRRDLAT
jgi:ABC-2 type transport system permease protein